MRKHYTRPRLGGLVLLAWGLAATGCASSAAKAPGAPETPEAEAPAEDGGDVDEEVPTSIDGAAAELARAESQVLAALGPNHGADGQPPPPAQPRAEREEAYGATAGDRCRVACRALASMQRAASRLCSIAGEDDARCHRADRRVSHATDLVHRSCSTCS